jgi:DNA modification methylase
MLLLVRETTGKSVAEFKTYSGDSIRSQGSELCCQSLEIIENEWRGQSVDDFERALNQLFAECHRVLKDDGCLALMTSKLGEPLVQW